MRSRAFLIGLALLAIAAIVATTVFVRSQAAAPALTVPVVRQTLQQTVTASGTVSPQNQVAVGTQVSGTISAIYVDFNSKVKKGQVLARLDTSTLQAQLDQASAQLAQAQAQARAQASSADAASAGVPSANATVEKARSALALAQSTLTRDQQLERQGYLAPSQVQTDNDAVVSAQSALQTAQAQAVQAGAQAAGGGASASAAQAGIAAARAQVQQTSLNMQRAVITSPVDGTVVDREISVGQTVAASLQTPTLFTIAQNLGKMQVSIAVGEPDIGSVKMGDAVDFSVLAYPNQTFHGVVTQVRDNPTTVSNVVTYAVIVNVDNPQGRLLPGMTANATIHVASAPNALVVPVQALHQRSAAQGATNGAAPWGQTSAAGGATSVQAGASAMLIVQRSGRTQPVPVRVMLVSGTQAAVVPRNGATLAAGDAAVISGGARRSQSSQRNAQRGGFNGGMMRGIH